MARCLEGNAPRRRWRASLALACLFAVVLALPGCSGDSAEPSLAGVGFDPNKALANPKDHVGPSSAHLGQIEVQPIEAQPAQSLPATVSDFQGTEVTITDTSRILALDIHGTLSQVVYGLGLGEFVVGRDNSSAFAQIKDKPLVTTNGTNLDAEAILSAAPSVIITDTSLGPLAVVDQMRESGIPVLLVSPDRSLETIGPLFQLVADALGVSDAGKALVERTLSQIDQAKTEIAKALPQSADQRLRVAFLYVRGTAGIYYLFGQDTGIDALVQALGGIDVASEVGWSGMQPVTDEGLVSMAPDVILMMTNGLESVGGVDGLIEKLPAVAATPAGRNRRIVDMDDSQLLAFGPNTASVLLALAGAIYSPKASQ
ncbi:MAG: ABC transporter substrate-binding protein [Micrococcales bacterium]|nr:ABC transporter substrate-binding protein [Micrococcales bacterium]